MQCRLACVVQSLSTEGGVLSYYSVVDGIYAVHLCGFLVDYKLYSICQQPAKYYITFGSIERLYMCI